MGELLSVLWRLKLMFNHPTRYLTLLAICVALLLAGCAPAALPTGTQPTVTGAPPTPTPNPAPGGELGPSELKYRLLAEFPNIFFCDPDFYPVSVGDELEMALQRFPELQANAEEFNAILAYNDLAGLATFSDEQKLLIYREHKKLDAIQFETTTGGYRFQLQVADSAGGTKLSGDLISGLIDSQGEITVKERKATIATCPICLAAGTLIDTPSGPLPVESLRPGTLVWTVDRSGNRLAQPVVQTGHTLVPDSHQVVDIRLDDGRQLWVSPGHPTVDGRRVGELQAGDTLDGADLLSAEWVTYTGGATFDLLPDSETGFYWANGILLRSTLMGR